MTGKLRVEAVISTIAAMNGTIDDVKKVLIIESIFEEINK